MVRQRPGTAKGVIFITLEDETGFVNVVVWEQVAERQRQDLLNASLLEVYGQLQKQDGVIHLIARRLADRTCLLGNMRLQSRDFH